MEKWDKGIKMFDEAAPVDKELFDKLALIQDYNQHRAGHVHLLSTPWRPHRLQVQALKLVKDPITGAYGLPDDKETVKE
jgi:hypothetical protein